MPRSTCTRARESAGVAGVVSDIGRLTVVEVPDVLAGLVAHPASTATSAVTTSVVFNFMSVPP